MTTPRPRCDRCALPLAACLCRWVTPTANRLPLLVLQHPDEARHAKGSVRLLALSLARCQRVVGRQLDAATLAALLQPQPADCEGAGTPLLLFPSADGAGAAGPPPPCAGPLVLLDGTWRQARALLRAHPLLQALPRWALPDPPPGRYTVRRAHRPAQQRSSLESACLALGLLEGRPAHYQPLLAAFDGWVASLAARQHSGG